MILLLSFFVKCILVLRYKNKLLLFEYFGEWCYIWFNWLFFLFDLFKIRKYCLYVMGNKEEYGKNDYDFKFILIVYVCL